jgi:hypothetical protein
VNAGRGQKNTGKQRNVAESVARAEHQSEYTPAPLVAIKQTNPS